MLFGVCRKAGRQASRDIFGHFDDASRHLPLECLSGRRNAA
jgi:hypothetical protein